MKLKKLMAGIAAMALSATMVFAVSAESSIDINDVREDAWTNAFGSYENADEEDSEDYLDARTFTKDQDLTLTVEFERSELWSAQPESAQYVLIGPGRSNGWDKFGDKKIDKLVTDYPQANHLEAGYSLDGEDVVKDGKTEPLFVKADGFIMVHDKNLNSVTFTIPKDEVNALIEEANTEDSWDGIIIQKNGNVKVTKVTASQDGVKLASQYEAENADSEGDSKAEESKADDSKAEDSKAEESSVADESSTTEAASSKASDSSSKTEDKKDDGLSTGAIIGIVAGVVVVLGVVVGVVVKKKD